MIALLVSAFLTGFWIGGVVALLLVFGVACWLTRHDP